MENFKRYTDQQIKIVLTMAFLRLNTVEEVFDVLGFQYNENYSTPLEVTSLFSTVGNILVGNCFRVFLGLYDISCCVDGRIIGTVDLDLAIDKFIEILKAGE